MANLFQLFQFNFVLIHTKTPFGVSSTCTILNHTKTRLYENKRVCNAKRELDILFSKRPRTNASDTYIVQYADVRCLAVRSSLANLYFKIQYTDVYFSQNRVVCSIQFSDTRVIMPTEEKAYARNCPGSGYNALMKTD